MQHFKPTLSVVVAALSAAPTLAQQSPFRTPGMPVRTPPSGQTDRFTNDFNPAIGGVIDTLFDYSNPDVGDDGFQFDARVFELTINGRIDPQWWGYGAIVAVDGEIEIEEGVAVYQPLDSHTSVRVGRFFVDFGKQMQAHVHDLAYPERPGVLREYLGDELSGVGAQVDHWWATGESSALRASFAAFSGFDLHEHSGEEEEEGPEAALAERAELDELALTARVTQFMDVGERGVFQWGLSARYLPEFSFVDETNALAADGLSNTVLGVDLTYGIDDADGIAGWTFGAEYLMQMGDLSAESDGTALTVTDDDVAGYYAWAERRFDRVNSAGVLFSSFEHGEDAAPRQDELTLYYTRNLTEYARLRFVAAQVDSEEDGDTTRGLIQLTTWFGPHSHAVSW